MTVWTLEQLEDRDLALDQLDSGEPCPEASG